MLTGVETSSPDTMAAMIHIREIRPSDEEGREMESLGLQAFTDVAMHKVLFPKGEETREVELGWRSQRFWTNLRNSSKRFVVAVEETALNDGTSKKEIIGWARWTSAPAVPEPEKSEEDKAKEMQEKMKSWPDAMDKEAYKKILEGFVELDKQWLDGDDPSDYWGEKISMTVCLALKLTTYSPRCPCRAPGPSAKRTWIEAD